jgi:hypothetical protein
MKRFVLNASNELDLTNNVLALTTDNVKDVFGYPRPQMTRDAKSFTNMNGLWEWESATSSANPPFGKTLSGSILVPFPVEACLSGIGENHPQMWYRTSFQTPGASNGGSTLLHFGAVDWMASVYLNGKLLGNHTGRAIVHRFAPPYRL